MFQDEIKCSGLESLKDDHTFHNNTPSAIASSNTASPKRSFTKVLEKSKQLAASSELMSSTQSGKKLAQFMKRGSSLVCSEVNIESKKSSCHNSIHKLMNIMELSSYENLQDSEACAEMLNEKLKPIKASSQRFVHFKDTPDVCEFEAGLSCSEDLSGFDKDQEDDLNKAMCDTERLSENAEPLFNQKRIEPCTVECKVERSRKKVNTRFQLGIYDKLNFLDVCKRHRLDSISVDKKFEEPIIRDKSERISFSEAKPINIDVETQKNYFALPEFSLNRPLAERSYKSRSASKQNSIKDADKFGIITPPELVQMKSDREVLQSKFYNVLEAVKKKSSNATADTYNQQSFKLRHSTKSTQNLPHSKIPSPSEDKKATGFNLQSVYSVKSGLSQKAKACSFLQYSKTRSCSKSNYRSLIQIPECQPFAQSEANCQRLSVELTNQNQKIQDKNVEARSTVESPAKPSKISKLKCLGSMGSLSIQVKENLPSKLSPTPGAVKSAHVRRSPVFFGGLDSRNLKKSPQKKTKIDLASYLSKANSAISYNLRASIKSDHSGAFASQRSTSNFGTKKVVAEDMSSPAERKIREAAKLAKYSKKSPQSSSKPSPITKVRVMTKQDSLKIQEILLTKVKTPVGAVRPLAQRLLSKLIK